MGWLHTGAGRGVRRISRAQRPALFFPFLRDVYRDQGLSGAAAYVALDPVVLFVVGVIAVVLLTVAEPSMRRSTLDTYYFALFYPACIAHIAGMGSQLRALIIGFAMGLCAGIVATEHANWATYLAPNMAQMSVFAWLVGKWAPESVEPGRRFWGRVAAAVCAIAIGSTSGTASLIITELYYYHVVTSTPMALIAGHWAVGDLSCTGLGLVILYLAESHFRTPIVTAS